MDRYPAMSWHPLKAPRKMITGWVRLIRVRLIQSCHLIRIFLKPFCQFIYYHFILKIYCYFEFHLIGSKNLPMNDFELTQPVLEGLLWLTTQGRVKL